MLSINVPNVITVMLIALLALAAYNFVQEKFGIKIPYLS